MTAYTERCSRSLVTSPAGVLEYLIGQTNCWFRIQQLKHQVARERRQLMLLSDAELKDLGISRYEAAAEAHRSDLPRDRLRNIG